MLREHRSNVPTRSSRKASPSAVDRGPRTASCGTNARAPHEGVHSYSRRQPHEVHESGLLGPLWQERPTPLEEIELLLMGSGLPPARVLREEEADVSYALDRSAGSGAPYCNRSTEVPVSVRMLDGSSVPVVDTDRWLHAPVQPSPYVWRLEQEVTELTEAHTAACAMLCDVAFSKDLHLLELRELQSRRDITEEAAGSLSQVQAFFHERHLMLREAAWRSLLERESVRAAVAEERARAVAEERDRTAAALAAKARAQGTAEDAAARLSAMVRALLAENSERIAALVEALPVRVQTALCAQHAEKSSRAAEAANSSITAFPILRVAEEELKAVIASVLREHLPAAVASGTVSSRGDIAVAQPPPPQRPAPLQATAPAVPGPASATEGPASPTAQRLSARHQSLLFEKVTHILHHIDDAFTKAMLHKSTVVTDAFLDQCAVHERTVEHSWHGVLNARRAEIRDMREQLLSVRMQRQQLLLSFHERSALPSMSAPDGGRRSPATSLRSAQSNTGLNAAYEAFVAPYIPPAVQATQPAVKHSLQALREDALRAGARPADYGPLTEVTHEVHRHGHRQQERLSNEVKEEEAPAAGAEADETETRAASPAAAAPTVTPRIADAAAGSEPLLDERKPSVAAAASPALLARGPTSAGVVSATQSGFSAALAVRSFRPPASSSSSSSSSVSDMARASVMPAPVESLPPIVEIGGGGPVRVEVQSVAVVETCRRARAATAGGDDDDEDDSADTSSAPAVVEATIESAGHAPTAGGGAAAAAVKTKAPPHSFDAESSSDTSTPSPPRARASPAAGTTTARGQALVPSSLRSLATLSKPTPATSNDLSSLSPLLQSVVASPRPAAVSLADEPSVTVRRTAALNSAPAAAAKKLSTAHKNDGDDDDSLSLTLTSTSSSSNGDGGGLGAKVAAIKPGKGSAPKRTAEPTPLAKVAGGKPALKRSAFDDDDTDDDATTTQRKSPAPAPVADAAGARNMSAPSASHTAATATAASALTTRKTVSLPW